MFVHSVLDSPFSIVLRCTNYGFYFPSQVDICVVIHQSVASKSLQYKAELSRYNYVTPTSYLELLGTFAKMAKIKQTELSTQRNRTKIGLDKVGMYLHYRLQKSANGVR